MWASLPDLELEIKNVSIIKEEIEIQILSKTDIYNTI